MLVMSDKKDNYLSRITGAVCAVADGCVQKQMARSESCLGSSCACVFRDVQQLRFCWNLVLDNDLPSMTCGDECRDVSS